MPSSESDLELRAYKVHEPAPEALQTVMAALQSSELWNVFYAIRSRTKSVEKIREKVLRKRRDDPEIKADYEPEDIRDVVGVRIVTLFREDLIEAVRALLAMIRHHPPYENSPFMRDRLDEAIIYSTTPIGDPQAIVSRIATLLRTDGFGDVVESKEVETGYSSIHLVVWCSVLREGGPHEVPIEIQIRTVFEDAWGEIHHQLWYERFRGLIASEGDPDEKQLQSHLNVLKTFSDGCARYADLIKAQVAETFGQKHPLGKIIPVEFFEDALQQIGDIDAEITERLRNAYQLRSDADAFNAKEQGAERQTAFLDAARSFQEIEDNEQEFLEQESKQAQMLKYFLRMEKGFCLLSVGTKESLDEAIAIYISVEDRIPESTVAYYRHGQALESLGQVEDAANLYKKTVELLQEGAHHLPEKHWLRASPFLRLGFIYWQQSLPFANRGANLNSRLELIVKAHETTQQALPFADEDTPTWIRIHNNLAYYAVEYLDLVEDGIEPKLTEEVIAPSLSVLEANVVIDQSDNVHRLDTLCRAYVHLGHLPQAAHVAKRVEYLLDRPELRTEETEPRPETFYQATKPLSKAEREILEHALWVLRKEGKNT